MDEQMTKVKDTIIELIININMRIDDICNRNKNEGSIDSDRLVNLLDDIQALAEGIDTIKGFYCGIDILELQEKLAMLERSFEEKDNLLLIDIIQYELRDLLNYWRECLSKT